MFFQFQKVPLLLTFDKVFLFFYFIVNTQIVFKSKTKYLQLLVIDIINRVVSRNRLESCPGDCSLELLGDGKLHKIFAVGDHDVHLTGLA